MVVTNDPALLEKAYHLKTQAVSPAKEYWHDMLGYNYRMTNICAAIGVAQLENIDAILEKKSRIAAWYDEYLAGMPLTRQASSSMETHSWWLYSILVEASDRDDLRKFLRTHLIETRPVFPSVHTFPHFSGGGKTFPVAERISSRGLSLPSYPELDEADVKLISSKIAAFFQNKTQQETNQTSVERAEATLKSSSISTLKFENKH